jgi:uncharacterized protein (TIGR02268 family)
MKWVLFAFCLLVSSRAAAQQQSPARQRQDRRASLPTTPAEPIPELHVAAGNLTTVAFNGPLDRDSLVVDRTRFRWVDVGDRLLALEPFADLGQGERLIVQIGFKDRALPAKAVIAVISDATMMDGKVEVDRRANTPEALLAALAQKDAELEELKARYAGSGPASLALSGWLNERLRIINFPKMTAPKSSGGVEVINTVGYAGTFSALIAIQLRNLPGQAPWAVSQVHITTAAGAPVPVLSVQMKQEPLEPGEEGLVVVETKTPPWQAAGGFRVEMVDRSNQRGLLFNPLP